uniref:Uncharacterized protein n=1 Tax=Anguilla anguilla TaxID=7936 RepID=A0A0E9RYS2_ANGAN
MRYSAPCDVYGSHSSISHCMQRICEKTPNMTTFIYRA